jgi:hypothetical protein
MGCAGSKHDAPEDLTAAKVRALIRSTKDLTRKAELGDIAQLKESLNADADMSKILARAKAEADAHVQGLAAYVPIFERELGLEGLSPAHVVKEACEMLGVRALRSDLETAKELCKVMGMVESDEGRVMACAVKAMRMSMDEYPARVHEWPEFNQIKQQLAIAERIEAALALHFSKQMALPQLVLLRDTQLQPLLEENGGGSCVPGETVSCVFMFDDWVDEVYYNGQDVRGRVTNLGCCCGRHELTFTPVPGAVLCIAGNDNQPGTSEPLHSSNRACRAASALSSHSFSPAIGLPCCGQAVAFASAAGRRIPTARGTSPSSRAATLSERSASTGPTSIMGR